MNFRKWIMARIVVPVLRRFPISKATNFVEGFGRWEFDRVPELRKELITAVNLAKTQLGADWDVESVTRQLAGRLIRWNLRDVLVDGPSARRALETFDIIGQENFDAAMAEGKGVILLSNHFGGHILPAHWMLRKGINFRFLTERPRHVSKSLLKHFEQTGPLGQKELFISRKKSGNDGVSSIFRSLRLLKAKHVVLVACDVRWNDNQSVVGRFMGELWKFTPIWAILAQRSTAPVLPCYCSMLPDGRHLIEFGAVEHVAPGQSLQAAVQASLDRVECKVKQDPLNSNDYFLWATDTSRASLDVRYIESESTEISIDQAHASNSPHFDVTANLAKRSRLQHGRD
ncbi:MAG: lysophospholipid acyltransferase family protein [Planctomycetota bacterium]